jgi:predicted transcriptional regulator
MEMSFQLKTLEPLKGALDILRMFGTTDSDTIDADTIIDTLDLTDRTFNKAMRRLVTKQYLQMDGDMVYRMTDNGKSITEELLAYDEAVGEGGVPEPVSTKQEIKRRMLCAMPAQFNADQPAVLFVGFKEATDEHDDPIEVVVRTTIINGEPESAEDLIFKLDNGHTAQAITVTPLAYTEVRVKMEVYQLGEMGDINSAGGMYVDLPVRAGNQPAQMVAYGTNIQLVI